MNEIAELKHDVTELKTRMAVAESNIKDVKEDISSIKNNTTWILRLIIGAFVMALLGLIIKGGI
ncbi:hemolysin XhlA family protein [Virgibacillus sp. Bac332]|uniref:hemolysin XhlA family protein n=1 Tax=Virgibacillus sp. Bac332 TaxID=2419842 RepID=UPI000EF43DCD|nr:hemolysin XhlA family protein [Virgibacillus sp. Bac332]